MTFHVVRWSLPVALVLVLAGVAPATALPAAPDVRAAAAPTAEPEKVNINTADVKTLTTLHGVGEKLAERIVRYRDAHGPFRQPEDLRKVDGIGTGLWERNRERIVIK